MIRLDKAVQTRIEQEYGIALPRTSINRILQMGGVRFNGEVIKKKGFKLTGIEQVQKLEINPDIVKAVIGEYTTGQVKQEFAQMWNDFSPIGNMQVRQEFIEKAPDISNDIMYQDQNILVAYKPPGVLSHPAQDDAVDNMIYRFLAYVKKVKNFMPRAGLLHRLDKDTQGAMMFALNLMTFNKIKQQFNNNQLIKLYIAVVVPTGNITRLGKKIVGVAKKQSLDEFLQVASQVKVTREGPDSVMQEGAERLFGYILSKPAVEIDGFIAMYRYENKAKFSFNKKDLFKKVFRKVKDASSVIYPLGYVSWPQQGNRGPAAYVLGVRLITGRTHQIRAQMQALGLPVALDTIYTPGGMDGALYRRYAQVVEAANKKPVLHLLSLGLGYYYLDGPERKYVAVTTDHWNLPLLGKIE